MLNTAVDYLIIGQGLAGSLLALELIRRNCKVLIVDNGIKNASQCAAGLINPITGMRFVKSWQVDTLLPVAKQHYQQLEQFFQQDFYVEKNILRIFQSEKERHHAQKKLQLSEYQSYLGQIHKTDKIDAPFGAIEQTQTGYLLTQPLLAALKQFFISKQSYQQANLNYAEINLTPQLSWQDIQAKHIIFCEGYQVCQNPWFSDLPLQPAKGEILTLQLLETLPDWILNYGHWMIPLDQNRCRTGATFDPVHLDTLPSENAKQQLLESLKRILPAAENAELIEHQANIRPCTLDKQPFIGRHPHYPNLGIFNGFGAKGSLQIPYYAQQFADFLLRGKNLDKAVDIQRYPFC